MLGVREVSDLDLQESLDSCRSSSLQCFKRVEEGIASVVCCYKTGSRD